MIRLSFYRGLFVAAITAATVSEMAEAVKVDVDDIFEDDDLLMPQTDIGLDNTANLISDVDSNTTATTAADADSEFITDLFNKAKGGISGLMTRAGSMFKGKSGGKVAQAQAKTNTKAKKAIVKNKKVANKKAKQTAKQKKDL